MFSCLRVFKPTANLWRPLTHLNKPTSIRHISHTPFLRASEKSDDSSASIFGDLLKEEIATQDTSIVQELPNTRGKFREQLCRTPMLKTSTKRLNLIAHLIKGLDVEKAMMQLMFLKRNHCEEVLWAIQEGCKIAKDIQKVDPRSFYIAWTYVCRGSYTKKVDIKGRGRRGMIRSPEAHMVIMLRDKRYRAEAGRRTKEKKLARRRVHNNERVINPRIPL